jgi:hypothetical protein
MHGYNVQIRFVRVSDGWFRGQQQDRGDTFETWEQAIYYMIARATGHNQTIQAQSECNLQVWWVMTDIMAE